LSDRVTTPERWRDAIVTHVTRSGDSAGGVALASHAADMARERGDADADITYLT
jgi:hypothetical protein